MKLKYNFVTNQVADKIVAVAVGEDIGNFNGFIKMNDVGEKIFNLLKDDISMEDLVAEMCRLYPAETESTIRENVESFVSGLKENGVME